MLATPAAVLSQDSQHEGSAEVQELAITGATLIDGTGAAPRPSTTIIVRDGRIAAVTPDADAESGMQTGRATVEVTIFRGMPFGISVRC